jgi:hypothetical protein
MSDDYPHIIDSHSRKDDRPNSKNPKNSKSFSNYFEMLKLNKQLSSNKSSGGEKDNQIQSIKERLLREAYLLQLEQ